MANEGLRMIAGALRGLADAVEKLSSEGAASEQPAAGPAPTPITKASGKGKGNGAPAPAPAVAAEAPKAPPPADKPPTADDVRSAVQKLIETKGREVAIALLGKYGVQRVSELKPESFGQVIAEAGAP